jgi:predicted HTH transcriptional regulator
MSPEALESLLAGARETDSVEFKGAMPWDKNILVRDILAMANVIDGGTIVIGVGEQGNEFVRQGLSAANLATYDYDAMRDQIDPFADPRVVFSCDVLTDSEGRQYAVIEVAPFEELPVICARDGADVQAGTIYFRSRSRRPESARVNRAEDMREIVETSISRRLHSLRRAGIVGGEAEAQSTLDAELGDL